MTPTQDDQRGLPPSTVQFNSDLIALQQRIAILESRLRAAEKRIAEAVAAERDHCAQIADLKAVNTGRGVCDEIAAAIRARAEQK